MVRRRGCLSRKARARDLFRRGTAHLTWLEDVATRLIEERVVQLR